MLISNEVNNIYSKYGRYIILLLAVAALSALGWFGYTWYNNRQEYGAQRDFAESGEEYYKFFSTIRPAAWSDIEQGITFRAQQHKSSVLYPYFLAYKADSLIHQGRNQEAVEILDNVLSILNKNSEFYYLYSIKRALLKIDFTDEQIKSQGIKDLEVLSQDKQNPYQDMAAYYLAYNAWNNNNKSMAKEIWNNMSKFENNQSLWAKLAQVRLQGIS